MAFSSETSRGLDPKTALLTSRLNKRMATQDSSFSKVLRDIFSLASLEGWAYFFLSAGERWHAFPLQSYRRRYNIITANGNQKMSAQGNPRLSVAAFRSCRLLEVSRLWRELEMWTQKCHEVNLKKASSAFIYAETLYLNGMNLFCLLNWCEHKFHTDWDKSWSVRFALQRPALLHIAAGSMIYDKGLVRFLFWSH